MDIVTPSVTFFPESDYTVIKKYCKKMFLTLSKKDTTIIYIFMKSKNQLLLLEKKSKLPKSWPHITILLP